MTWISIEPGQALLVGLRMLEAALLSNQALERLTALSGEAGLGGYRGVVEAELGSSRVAIVRNTQSWIDQGTDMLARTNRLIADQRAASMIGSVDSVSASIIGGTLVGSVTTAAIPGAMALGGAAIIGGTLVGAATSTSGSSMTVGGTLVGNATPMNGLGSVTIGGPWSSAASPASGVLALAGVVQKREEAMRAKLEAMRNSGAGTNANTTAVNSLIQAQTNRQFMDLMGRQGVGTSLLLAPTGSRLTRSGASAGYEITGTYGSTQIETPYDSR